MGETNNAGEETKVENTETGADNQDDKKSKDGGADEQAEGADKSDDDSADEGGDEGDEETTDDDEESKDDKSKDDKTKKPTPQADEPQTRKRTNVDFILERKNRKIEKLQGKKDDGADDESGEDDDIDEADEKTVGKVVKKVLAPFIEKQMQEEDANEIADFIKQNPDFAPYAEKVKKFASHESRKNMPIKSIFYEVAGDDLLKIGAKRAKKAGDEAKETQAGGGSAAGGGSEKGVWDLTPEEFAEKQEALRNKPRE